MSMGGSSGGGQAPSKLYFRNPSKEWPTIENWYGKQGQQFYNFLGNDPIFSKLYGGAADYFSSPTSPILGALQGQGLDYLQGGPSDISQALNKLGLNAATSGPSDLTNALQQFGMNQLQGGPSQLMQDVTSGARGLQQYGMNQLNAGPSDLLTQLTQGAEAGPSDLLSLMQSQSQEDLASRGALTPALNRDVRTRTLANAGAMGMGWTPGTLGTSLLDAEKYREQRDLQNRQYAATTEGLSQADIAQRMAIEGLGESDLTRRFGIAQGGQQALGAAQGLSAQELAQQFGFAQGADQTGFADLASRVATGQAGQGAQLADIASRFGIGQGVQGLSMQDIAQRFQIPLQVAQGGTQNFGALTNPLLSYLNNAFTPTVYGGGSQSDSGAGIGQLAGTIIGAVATAY